MYVQAGFNVALDTHLRSPVVSERASSTRSDWHMVTSWSQATVLWLQTVRKCQEKMRKKDNKFCPLGGESSCVQMPWERSGKNFECVMNTG